MPGTSRPVRREARGEGKDLEFVGVLVEAGLIDPASLVHVCKKLPVGEARRDITIKRAQVFLPK